MLSRVKDFLSRHRRKFLVTGLVVGGSVVLWRYAQHKCKEFAEREAREFLDRSQRQQHFKSTEMTCDETIRKIAPTIHSSILQNLKIDDLLASLPTVTNANDKINIWQKLKVLAFTQAAALVYSTSMLGIFFRIQLNLVGGYLVRDLNKESLSLEIQQTYLSLCSYFRNTGVKDLCELIEKHVQPILDNVSLKKPMTLRETEDILWAIQNSVEGNVHDSPLRNLAKFLLPPRGEIDVNSLNPADQSCIQNMISETVDLLESEEVTNLMRLCVSQGFSAMTDKLVDKFIPLDSVEPVAGPSSEQDEKAWSRAVNGSLKTTSFVHPSSVKVPMARLIPIIVKLTGNDRNALNSSINQIIANDMVRVFGANVYEAFGQKE